MIINYISFDRASIEVINKDEKSFLDNFTVAIFTDLLHYHHNYKILKYLRQQVIGIVVRSH